MLECAAVSHPSTRLWAGALAALGLLLVGQHASPRLAAAQPTLAAQTDAPLQGVVVHESTGQPVESATVSLIGTDIETQTGRFGGFAFPDPPLGLASVRVTAPGHPSVVQEVEVTADGIVFVQFTLPTVAAVLSELFVGIQRGRSSVFGAVTAADLLAIKVPSTRVRSGILGQNDYSIRLRGFNSITPNSGPLVLIDGILIVEEALEALRQIPAEDVQDIEILRGPTAAFLFPFAAAGVVLVTTRQGRAR